MSEIKFLAGKQVYLRALRRGDLTGPMMSWTDDEEVTRYMYRGWRPSRLEELEAEFDKTIASNKNIEFAVCAQSDDRHVGVAGLHEIDWLARNAELRIMIGDKSAWGKGYGTEATSLLITYGFEKLNLNRIGLGVNAEDVRAIKCYEKAGFIREGVLRELIFRNNQYYDAVAMSLLRYDYESSKK